ncbi:SpoIIE family protein phosphatase [Streptomyces sp. V4-01]|uniref:SpoIIE family protein phosphatase n=1 Tax=Actinacidiphila polyblastidii TaxID=3110430 RepID=A0ABU7PDN4_9ACTN|nr:SpoIIE family protein phosphatase [Streptomyces sp. V4-01]
MDDPQAAGRPAPADCSTALAGGVLDVVDLGVYLEDDRGTIVAANPRAEHLLARSAADLLGRDAHDVLHRGGDGRPLPRAVCPMHHAMLGGRVAPETPGWLERGDGTLLPVLSLVAPFRMDEETTGALLLFHLRAVAEPSEQAAAPPAALTELERLALLAETTTRLTSTLDTGEALQRLAHIVAPRLAEWVVVDLIGENDEVWRTSVVHHTGGALVERDDLCGPLPPVSLDSPLPLSRALRGAASTLATPATYEGRLDSGLAVEQRRLFKAAALHSAIIAPIRGPREVLGALTLGRTGRGGPFTTDDLPLLEEITRRAGIALENARLYERQRRVAETFQRHLLPKLPVLPDLEATVRYLSAPDASQVGGDWYDMFPLSDGSVAVAIGDVVGHDLDAAAGMAQVRNILRAHAWSHDEGPGAVVRRLDDTVMHVTDVSMATTVFGRLERDTAAAGWLLRWANAGHPPPLLVEYDGRARFLLESRGLLLGTGTAPARADATVALPPRSTLVLYTDGLIESRGHPLDEGLEQLRRHAAALVHRPLESFCDELLHRVRPPSNDDDVAMLALRVPPHGDTDAEPERSAAGG